MNRLKIIIVFKFLLGIFLLQATGGVLVYAALKAGDTGLWPVLAVLVLSVSLPAAFWFASMAGNFSKDALAKVQSDFSRQREQLRLKAERQKSRVMKQSQQQIVKERDRVLAKASFKVGVSFASVLGLGLLMLFAQFVTVGLLTLTTAGGALGGYLFRLRQERAAKRDTALVSHPVTRVVESALPPGDRALTRDPQRPSVGTPAAPR